MPIATKYELSRQICLLGSWLVGNIAHPVSKTWLPDCQEDQTRLKFLVKHTAQ